VRRALFAVLAVLLALTGCSTGPGQVDVANGGEFRFVEATPAGEVIPEDRRATAPEFGGTLLDGEEFASGELADDVAVINFWGSWCPPCRAEMPDIQAAYQQLAPKGLTLLAISVDESALDAAAFAALNDATFTILSDPNRLGTGPTYPIFNFPTHLFIDRDGTVRSVVLADMDVETAIAQGEAVL
jgi:thiol-disulfide isomerase/thioredoxin